MIIENVRWQAVWRKIGTGRRKWGDIADGVEHARLLAVAGAGGSCMQGSNRLQEDIPYKKKDLKMNTALGMLMRLLSLKKLSMRMSVTGTEWDRNGGDTKQVDRSWRAFKVMVKGLIYWRDISFHSTMSSINCTNHSGVLQWVTFKIIWVYLLPWLPSRVCTVGDSIAWYS